jgi:hypothetical protein
VAIRKAKSHIKHVNSFGIFSESPLSGKKMATKRSAEMNTMVNTDAAKEMKKEEYTTLQVKVPKLPPIQMFEMYIWATLVGIARSVTSKSASAILAMRRFVTLLTPVRLHTTYMPIAFPKKPTMNVRV